LSKESKLKEYSQSCPFFINYHGFIKHMSIKQHPRLITEIISPSWKLYELEAGEPLATNNSGPFVPLRKEPIAPLKKTSISSLTPESEDSKGRPSSVN
jgi:hypothetical protein